MGMKWLLFQMRYEALGYTPSELAFHTQVVDSNVKRRRACPDDIVNK
jgi:hypothetical protein